MRRQTEQLLEEDPALFDPLPAWFVPEGERSSYSSQEDDFGFRVLLEQPEILLSCQLRGETHLLGVNGRRSRAPRG